MYTIYSSPIGDMKIVGTKKGIAEINFVLDRKNYNRSRKKVLPQCMRKCIRQLNEYFYGTRTHFDLKLIFTGTDFQVNVWKNLCSINYGTTASYKDVAVKIGNPKSCCAVGNANGKNKHLIVIPCHRVIGSNGDLVGYSSGVWRKKWLISHELDMAN